MLCRNIGDLIFAEFISAFSFAIKGIAETSLLGLSIPNSRYKKENFSKINSKGSTGYYILNAISKVLAGYLFTINAYLPLVLSLVILIVSTIISCFFIEPEKKKKENFDIETGVKEIKDITVKDLFLNFSLNFFSFFDAYALSKLITADIIPIKVEDKFISWNKLIS